MDRLVIHPKDIQIVTGRTDRYGRKLISRIKTSLNKQPHQLVTIEEFCNYTGLELQEVKRQIHN